MPRLARSTAAALVAFTVVSGFAAQAFAMPPAAQVARTGARTSAPSTAVVLGVVRNVDRAQHELSVADASGPTRVILPAGTPVLVHEVPASLADIRPGMTVFAAGVPIAARTRAVRVAEVRALTPASTVLTTTGTVVEVDPNQHVLVLQNRPYAAYTLALLPAGAKITNATTGRAMSLNEIPAGSRARVSGRPDGADRTTIVVGTVQVRRAR